MSAAAYDRGSAVISRQIRAEGEAARLVPVDRQYLDTIEGERDRLLAEVAALKSRLARADLRLRERRATLAVERAARVEERDSLERNLRVAHRAMLAFRARWEYTSRLLRRLDPRLVREAREELAAEMASVPKAGGQP